jgi:hypothetical protein
MQHYFAMLLAFVKRHCQSWRVVKTHFDCGQDSGAQMVPRSRARPENTFLQHLAHEKANTKLRLLLSEYLKSTGHVDVMATT